MRLLLCRDEIGANRTAACGTVVKCDDGTLILSVHFCALVLRVLRETLPLRSEANAVDLANNSVVPFVLSLRKAELLLGVGAGSLCKETFVEPID